ncbi:transmembrane protein 53-A-like [Saccostrea echinata]|uniref:transmembrane protein 53-A-like n=1 Tax=Saccostrea echinata TaxID=191078 RepID=UPI002A814D72|nr:transmembrane protein 53-A-like [Saccostrea echinata]
MESSSFAFDDHGFPLLRCTSKCTQLVLFFGWLNATPRAIQRYADLYHSSDYDFLYIPGHVAQFVWPANSLKLARRLLEYVEKLPEYQNILCHAISIGAYNYTSCLMLLNDIPNQYNSFKDRFRGVIFDSLTLGSTEKMKNGVKHGLTQNRVVQFLIPRLLSLYFCLTYNHTLKFFETGVKLFVECPLQMPTLFVYSRDDPMCDAEKLDAIIKKWREEFDFTVSFVCWSKSKHAMHIKEHKKDYMEAFIDFINCVKQQSNNLKCKSNL